jgi:Tol biopolymer transport system component
MKTPTQRTLPSPSLRRASWIVVALLAAVTLNAAPKNDSAKVMFEAARKHEVVDGDLNAAIAQYRSSISTYKDDRAIVADALIRMADCYRKLGNTESRKIYERVVKDYADQKEALSLARARLGVESGAGENRMSLRQAWKVPSQARLEGAISRDGRYLPYIGQNGDLFLHDFSSNTDRRLTDWMNNGGFTPDGHPTEPKGRDHVAEPRLSGDGRHLVYLRYRTDPSHPSRYELRIMDLTDDGMPQPRILLAAPDVSWIGPADWSPDGKSIAVLIDRRDNTGQIGLVSVSTGVLRVLKSVDWRGAGGVSFSPDGKYLGFDLPQHDNQSERDVFVLAVDGTREVHAVAHPSDDVMMGWSPDGRWLLFASDRTGSTSIWGLPFYDGKPQGAAESLKADIAAHPRPIGVTHTSALYYTVRGNQDRYKIQIGSFDFATGKYLSGPTDLTQDYLESNLLPSWSKDGRRLAYVSTRSPLQRVTNRVLVIRSMDTGEIRELRPKLGYFGLKIWAPGGESLLTKGTDLKGRNGLFHVDAKTGEVSTFLLDQPGEISWLPHEARDGKSIYFRRDYRATKDAAYIQRDLATGKETELIRRRVLSLVHMTPDRRYFLTRGIDESTNARTLELIAVAGGEVRELLRYPSELPVRNVADETKGVWFQPWTWAPDNRSFLARKTRSAAGVNDQGFETWRIPIDGGAPQKLEENFLKVDFAVGPDGRTVASTVIEKAPRREPEIWVLENFLPASLAANK